MSGSSLSVIVNSSGGTARRLGDALETKLRDAFAAAGHEADPLIVPGDRIARAIAATDSEVVAVGGGDGTVATAAAVLSGTGRRLAVLPLGTLNHFARAIGVDGTLEQAATVAVSGKVQAVDLGELGGRVFVNNASIGLYARMVADRDRRHLPKWLATVPAAFHVLANPGARRTALTIDGERRRVKTPLLFIGNNRYALSAGHVGERESLSDGLLSLYAVAPRGRAGLVLSALRILFGRFDPHSDFAALAEGREILVEGHGDHHVALDGEVLEPEFPLTVSIRPRALSVMVPAEA